MAEVITETIIPGTYIEVRAEGLLTVGAISTGNIGIIGTAGKGTGKIERLSSFEEARAKFGGIPAWDPNDASGNLSLVRALKPIFDNGARTVYAQRVYESDTNKQGHAKPALYSLDKSNAPLLKLKATSPGTWGNQLQVRIEDGENKELITNEPVKLKNGKYILSSLKTIPLTADDQSAGSVRVTYQGLTRKYQLKRTAPSGSVAQVTPADGEIKFHTAPPAAADVHVDYWVPKENIRKITFKYENFREVYIVPSVYYLNHLIADPQNPSKLVEADGAVVAPGLPDVTTRFEPFTGGTNGSVTIDHYKTALDNLVDQNIQIVAVPGPSFADLKAPILGHVEKTENLGRERMAVIGADSNDVDKILENANEIADKRVILVAPGLKQKDPQTGKIMTLPAYLTAAAVAGKMSSVAPHTSLTNKTLAGIDDIAVEYNYGQMKALLENRVLPLQKKRGIRVVKGITTHDEAYKQITLRRIVDYIKEGTRRGANQYIGKLNNARVRGALHTTLNNFLTDMLSREFLTGYKLNVFADRAMEIRGEVQVVMDLNPTFSIDVIRVVMNLS